MLRDELYSPWFLEDKKWGFKILSGEFQDVVVEVKKIEFHETEEGNFDIEYFIVHKPSLLSDDDVKNELFRTTFDTIINDIVGEAIEALDEKHRNDDTKKSNP